MLGQPQTMLVPEVIGFRLTGRLPEGTTATDLVLTVTEMLRKRGVVNKFVEFFGTGLSNLSVADRATIGNMSPEYGSTVAIFPIDQLTLDYLKLTGRSESHIELVRAYAKAQGLFRTDATPDPIFTDLVEVDLGSIEPNLAVEFGIVIGLELGPCLDRLIERGPFWRKRPASEVFERDLVRRNHSATCAGLDRHVAQCEPSLDR